jgi:hypothetical protein
LDVKPPKMFTFDYVADSHVTQVFSCFEYSVCTCHSLSCVDFFL